MSLHEKQALANQLRGELSALRLERESVLQGAHDSVIEEQLDAENERLLLEVETERTALTEAAGGDGSVADAITAMYSAAEAETVTEASPTGPPTGPQVTPQEMNTKEEQPVAASTSKANKAVVLDLPVQTSGEEK